MHCLFAGKIRVWLSLLSIAVIAALLGPGPNIAGAGPTSLTKSKPHLSPLSWAEKLLAGLRHRDSSYRHKNSVVHWKGVDAAKKNESHTDCSGFLNALFKQAFGLTDDSLNKWLGSKRPLAKHYHDAIKKGKHFKRILAIGDVKPGDIIAIKYPKPEDGDGNPDKNTGHVLLVVKKPHKRMATVPLQKGTIQWEITIMDQSRSGHGKTDTRHKKDGSYYSGLGQGVLRIYTTKNGTVKGYSWSIAAQSNYYEQKLRNLVFGRISGKIKP